MGKPSGSAPQPPNPLLTTALQQQLNDQSVRQNAAVNHPSSNTPFGSTQWSSPDGFNYTSNTTLSPQEQGIFNAQEAGRLQLANQANNMAGQLPGLFNSPFTNPSGNLGPNVTNAAEGAFERAINATSGGFQSGVPQMEGEQINGYLPGMRNAFDRASNAISTPFDAKSAADSAFNAINSRLSPGFDQQQSALAQHLASQGITEGSEAWDNAMKPLGQQRNDAQQQALLNSNTYAQQQEMLNMIPVQEAQGMIGAGANAITGITQGGNTMMNNEMQNYLMPWQVAGAANQNAQSLVGQAGANEQQALAARDAPLNELNALLQSSQVQMPGAPQTTNQSPVTTNAAGILGQNFAQQQQAYQNNLQATSANLQGMTALGGTALNGLFSGVTGMQSPGGAAGGLGGLIGLGGQAAGSALFGSGGALAGLFGGGAAEGAAGGLGSGLLSAGLGLGGDAGLAAAGGLGASAAAGLGGAAAADAGIGAAADLAPLALALL